MAFEPFLAGCIDVPSNGVLGMVIAEFGGNSKGEIFAVFKSRLEAGRRIILKDYDCIEWVNS
jgi:hypothetical protein